MSYPNFPDKHRGASLLTGAGMIAYRRSVGRFPKMAAPKSVLMCLETSMPRVMRRRYRTRKVGRFVGDMLLLRRAADKVGVMVNFGGGGPMVAGVMEELIAWGVQNFILISWAGILQEGLAEGQILVCNRAIRDEGVSHHYLPAGKYIEGDGSLQSQLESALTAHGVGFEIGPSWTTDAPYRETHAEIKAYQAEGVVAAEMEAAAMFAVGQALGVRTTAAFVLSDLLILDEWQPPQNIEAVMGSFKLLYAAILDLMAEL